jgi:hypothetical protein
LLLLLPLLLLLLPPPPPPLLSLSLLQLNWAAAGPGPQVMWPPVWRNLRRPAAAPPPAAAVGARPLLLRRPRRRRLRLPRLACCYQRGRLRGRVKRQQSAVRRLSGAHT